MTQSPFGGAASAPMGAGSATSEFGATTLSGPNRSALGSTAATSATGNASAARSATNARPTRPRGPRRARLQLRHVGPLTVLKFSTVLAIALFFVWLIMVGVLYGVLDRAGVIEQINSTVHKINGTTPVTAHVVFEVAAIIGAINVVLFVALATIGSVIYNLCADLVGGVEVTLSER